MRTAILLLRDGGRVQALMEVNTNDISVRGGWEDPCGHDPIPPTERLRFRSQYDAACAGVAATDLDASGPLAWQEVRARIAREGLALPARMLTATALCADRQDFLDVRVHLRGVPGLDDASQQPALLDWAAAYGTMLQQGLSRHLDGLVVDWPGRAALLQEAPVQERRLLRIEALRRAGAITAGKSRVQEAAVLEEAPMSAADPNPRRSLYQPPHRADDQFRHRLQRHRQCDTLARHCRQRACRPPVAGERQRDPLGGVCPRDDARAGADAGAAPSWHPGGRAGAAGIARTAARRTGGIAEMRSACLVLLVLACMHAGAARAQTAPLLDIAGKQVPLTAGQWIAAGDAAGRLVPEMQLGGFGLIRNLVLLRPAFDGHTVAVMAEVNVNEIGIEDGWGLAGDCEASAVAKSAIVVRGGWDAACWFVAARAWDWTADLPPAWRQAQAAAARRALALPHRTLTVGLRVANRQNVIDLRFHLLETADTPPRAVLAEWASASLGLLAAGLTHGLPAGRTLPEFDLAPGALAGAGIIQARLTRVIRWRRSP